ncbi:alpha-mannosidase [Gracilibacillus oryzae]|uniref:alpha-mannosidase n=1 Tax=Gracilibacillus oryzae TaxID=1672701 RepID=UPI001D18BDC6|nr:alpha-mannosidase [Gracilibacillus oryzae]
MSPNKKKIHIISHTHWDREWYLPYEKHHYLLIEFMDKLIDTLETDPDFQSFHLDGQTIILDDYLQVRPELRSKLKSLVEAGRIHVGPWYILQDEFLTSSEANVRNLQYGQKDAKKWGNVSQIGYFPDSFGNMGQAAQLLQQAGIKHAAFGRGVKPTGFNNLVSETAIYESPYSEMKWTSPDGSSVTGILFANWYCNGNEVPVEAEAARKYWDGHIEAMEKFAASDHLLMLNGCDHQPIQTDLSKAIKTAEALYPEYEFIHSNFNDYVKELDQQLDQTKLKEIEGELRSQHTDGWGTLVNTASSRVYLKQMNQEVQTLLEKEAEPLAAFAYLLGEKYDHDILEYAWKTLMQNHPHDSICGCSVDEVHREMVTRFEKSKHMTESFKQATLEKLGSKIDTSSFAKYGENAVPFVVFNTTAVERTGVVTVEADFKRVYFSEGIHRKSLEEFSVDGFILVDADGTEYDYQMEDVQVVFDYDLPEHRFRQPYMAKRVKAAFEVKDTAPFSHQTFAFVEAEKTVSESPKIAVEENTLENRYLKVEINPNGSLTIFDKQTNEHFPNLLIYEDSGDVGNEYMYKQPAEDMPITTENVKARIRLAENSPIRATYEIIHQFEMPESGEDLLQQERQQLVWFTSRKAKRSTKQVLFTIKTKVSLEKNGTGVDVTAEFENNAKDHRLRVLFPTNIEAEEHFADSIFEVAKRPNQPAEEWNNPDHSQHQHAFVSIYNEEKGITIANKGLQEYELLRDGNNTIAVTLLRSVGELGDWGYFPTPEAQCLGTQTASFKILPHIGNKKAEAVYQEAYQYPVEMPVLQIPVQFGEVPGSYQYISCKADEQIAQTSLKVSQTTEDLMIRCFNMTNKAGTVHLMKNGRYEKIYESNVVEEKLEAISNDRAIEVKPYEIKTIGIIPDRRK